MRLVVLTVLIDVKPSMHGLRRHSPTLQGINVVARRKVRRAKLFYLRDRKPSAYSV